MGGRPETQAMAPVVLTSNRQGAATVWQQQPPPPHCQQQQQQQGASRVPNTRRCGELPCRTLPHPFRRNDLASLVRGVLDEERPVWVGGGVCAASQQRRHPASRSRSSHDTTHSLDWRQCLGDARARRNLHPPELVVVRVFDGGVAVVPASRPRHGTQQQQQQHRHNGGDAEYNPGISNLGSAPRRTVPERRKARAAACDRVPITTLPVRLVGQHWFVWVGHLYAVGVTWVRWDAAIVLTWHVGKCNLRRKRKGERARLSGGRLRARGCGDGRRLHRRRAGIPLRLRLRRGGWPW